METASDGINDTASEIRTFRQGNYHFDASHLGSNVAGGTPPLVHDADIGLRIASVPELSSAVLVICAGFIAFARRRRRL
jgi:hypothetical protein